MNRKQLFYSIKTEYLRHGLKKDIFALLLVCITISALCAPMYALTMPEKIDPKYIIVPFDPSWEFADKSKISSGSARLYKGMDGMPVICVNAGHGTVGGTLVKTLAHPDGSPKVTGGSSPEGVTEVFGVTDGMIFADGTPEPVETLRLAFVLRDILLSEGFSVLMPRFDADARLDNVARVVTANALADCHVALHFDATSSDKGMFYIGVPSQASYREMYPVSGMWRMHEYLGRSVTSAAKHAGIGLFNGGRLEVDLTQTAYSTIPSIALECGDKITSRFDEDLQKIARAIADGIIRFISLHSK